MNFEESNFMTTDDISVKNVSDKNLEIGADIDILNADMAEMKSEMQEMALRQTECMKDIKKMNKDFMAMSKDGHMPVDACETKSADDISKKHIAVELQGALSTISINDYAALSLFEKYSHINKIESDHVRVIRLPEISASSNGTLSPGFTAQAGDDVKTVKGRHLEVGSTYVNIACGTSSSPVYTQEMIRDKSGYIAHTLNQKIHQAFFMYAEAMHGDANMQDRAPYIAGPGVQSIFTGITGANADANTDHNMKTVAFADFQRNYQKILNSMKVRISRSERYMEKNLVWLMSSRMYYALQAESYEKNGVNDITKTILGGHPIAECRWLMKAANGDEGKVPSLNNPFEFIILADLRQCYSYHEQDGIVLKPINDPQSRDEKWCCHQACAGVIVEPSLVQFCRIEDVPALNKELELSVAEGSAQGGGSVTQS